MSLGRFLWLAVSSRVDMYCAKHPFISASNVAAVLLLTTGQSEAHPMAYLLRLGN